MIFRLSLAASVVCTSVIAQEAGLRAKAAYQHFYCHHVISYMADMDSAPLLDHYENHVWSGFKEARGMMKDIELYKGANKENWNQNAPANWGYYLNSGPSEDFIIGMLFEQVRGVVEREVLQEEDGRFILNNVKYQENAKAAFYESGCKDLN